MKQPKTTLPDLNGLVKNLLPIQGISPDQWSALVLPIGTVCVRAPGAGAYDPAEAWSSKFMRQLHQGFFRLGHPAGPVVSVTGAA